MLSTRTRQTKRPTPALQVPEAKRAFISRGLDLMYRAKRLTDGEIIATDPERGAAKHAAERLGYFI